MQDSNRPEFAAGQLWRFKCTGEDEHSRLLILRVEAGESERIVHVSIVGHSEGATHMPFTESAVRQSVTALEAEGTPLPDFEEGYLIWRREFDLGKAGVYNIAVSDAIGL